MMEAGLHTTKHETIVFDGKFRTKKGVGGTLRFIGLIHSGVSRLFGEVFFCTPNLCIYCTVLDVYGISAILVTI